MVSNGRSGEQLVRKVPEGVSFGRGSFVARSISAFLANPLRFGRRGSSVITAGCVGGLSGWENDNCLRASLRIRTWSSLHDVIDQNMGKCTDFLDSLRSPKVDRSVCSQACGKSTVPL